MSQRGLLVVIALSALLLGGLGWALTRDADRPAGTGHGHLDDAHAVFRAGANAPVDGRDTAATSAQETPARAATQSENPQSEIIRPEDSGKVGDSPANTEESRSRDSGATQGQLPSRKSQSDAAQPETPKGQAGSAPVTPTLPTPARVPTPRERAEQARYAGGVNLPKANAIPKVSSNGAVEQSALDMARLAEPEVWNDYWAREGYAPPAMIKTPVRGKLMERLTQKGIGGATVRLFTFFPATSQLGGAVLPVVMEAASDEQGFFACDLPVPAKWPTAYAKLALSVEHEKLRMIDALVVPDLRIGEPNEIGVFWAPEEPYEVEVKVTAARTGLAVAATGRIDPRRWEAKRAAKIFGYFNRVPVGASGAKLQGTWDILADSPYVTLLENGAPVLTQEAERILDPPPGVQEDPHGETQREYAIGKPFVPVVFANDGYIALTGRVAGPDDQPVAGATITLTGDGDARIAFSDSVGWFHFSGLRDMKVALRTEHPDFIAAESGQIATTTTDLLLKFEHHRPRVNLTITRADTGQPVTAIWFHVNGYGLPPAFPPASYRVASASGYYPFEWDKPVMTLHVTATGLKPLAIAFGETEQAIAMESGLPLSRRPRDYDTASWPEGWHTEGETPCLWSLDDDHWVEYKFNLGETEAPFALELGVKNHSYGTLPLDNEYLFEVEVSLDGQKVATLSIPSDAQVPRYVLQQLGTLKGEHTIRLKWLNDRYIPGQLDANISYESIELFATAP